MPSLTPVASGGNAVLLLSCPDRRGLVSMLSQFVFERGGNIVDLDEHVDPVERRFFIRISWSLEEFSIPDYELEEAFRPLAEELGAEWSLRFTGRKSRVAVFVSRYDHCLQELLWRHAVGEFQIDIPLIVSNHPDLRPLADHYGILFQVIPLTGDNRAAAEEEATALLEVHDVDWVVLARYMQVLSPPLWSGGRGASSTSITLSCPRLWGAIPTGRRMSGG